MLRRNSVTSKLLLDERHDRTQRRTLHVSHSSPGKKAGGLPDPRHSTYFFGLFSTHVDEISAAEFRQTLRHRRFPKSRRGTPFGFRPTTVQSSECFTRSPQTTQSVAE
jgi:hypothetical protein